MRTVVGTRFWANYVSDLDKIDRFVEAAEMIGKVRVAVNVEEDGLDSANRFPGITFPVTPWGKFVQPLNALILQAAGIGADFLLLASVEFPPVKEHVEALIDHMDENTLVVGAKFDDHIFWPSLEKKLGTRRATGTGNGLSVPWNTFALWRVTNGLERMGVPLISDFPSDTKMAGMEEFATIALYQKVWPDTMKAKLVDVPGFEGKWNMIGWNDNKLTKHGIKMVSKLERAEFQLGHLNIPPPQIEHIL